MPRLPVWHRWVHLEGLLMSLQAFFFMQNPTLRVNLRPVRARYSVKPWLSIGERALELIIPLGPCGFLCAGTMNGFSDGNPALKTDTRPTCAIYHRFVSSFPFSCPMRTSERKSFIESVVKAQLIRVKAMGVSVYEEAVLERYDDLFCCICHL